MADKLYAFLDSKAFDGAESTEKDSLVFITGPNIRKGTVIYSPERGTVREDQGGAFSILTDDDNGDRSWKFFNATPLNVGSIVEAGEPVGSVFNPDKFAVSLDVDTTDGWMSFNAVDALTKYGAVFIDSATDIKQRVSEEAGKVVATDIEVDKTKPIPLTPLQIAGVAAGGLTVGLLLYALIKK